MQKFLKRIAVAAGLAAVGGYIAGLLTAPKSGKEMREDIKEATTQKKAEAEQLVKNLSMELADLLADAKKRSAELNGKTRDELESLMASARAAREKARSVVGAVRSGDSTDDDLRLAATQARNALKHLRAYLKK